MRFAPCRASRGRFVAHDPMQRPQRTAPMEEENLSSPPMLPAPGHIGRNSTSSLLPLWSSTGSGLQLSRRAALALPKNASLSL
jgi:hypothetical protein